MKASWTRLRYPSLSRAVPKSSVNPDNYDRVAGTKDATLHGCITSQCIMGGNSEYPDGINNPPANKRDLHLISRLLSLMAAVRNGRRPLEISSKKESYEEGKAPKPIALSCHISTRNPRNARACNLVLAITTSDRLPIETLPIKMAMTGL